MRKVTELENKLNKELKSAVVKNIEIELGTCTGAFDEIKITFENGFTLDINSTMYDYDFACLEINDEDTSEYDEKSKLEIEKEELAYKQRKIEEEKLKLKKEIEELKKKMENL